MYLRSCYCDVTAKFTVPDNCALFVSKIYNHKKAQRPRVRSQVMKVNDTSKAYYRQTKNEYPHLQNPFFCDFSRMNQTGAFL